MDKPPLHSKTALFKWTKKVLREYNIRPREKYSQSFSIDPFLIKSVVNSVCSLDCKCVCEIGSGLGTLTYYLAEKCYRVIAIEIDKVLALVTSRVLEKSYNTVIINGDGLEVPWNCDCTVSNTPYNITSDILIKLARTNTVKYGVFVLQKEVVDRLKATPGSRDYGRLTVLIKLLFDIEAGPVFHPDSFYPKPKVFSQLVILRRKHNYEAVHSILEEVTRVIFSEKRKKAISVLNRKLGIDYETLRSIGLSEDLRVYELCPEMIMNIARTVMEKRYMLRKDYG